MAMYLSLVVSCRLNGVKVMEYISDYNIVRFLIHLLHI